MTPDQTDLALKYVEVSGYAVKAAMDEISVHRQAQQLAKRAAAGLTDELIQLNVLDPNQKEAVDVMTASHAETLSLLRMCAHKLAAERTERAKSAAASRSLGQSAAPDTLPIHGAQRGDYDSLSDPHLGRRTTQKKASDEPLLALIR